MEESCEVEEGKLDALSKSLSSAGKEEACEITRMFIEQLIENDEEDVHYTISNARHYIDEHLAEDISVSSIAESLYITPNYFSRLYNLIIIQQVLTKPQRSPLLLHYVFCISSLYFVGDFPVCFLNASEK